MVIAALVIMLILGISGAALKDWRWCIGVAGVGAVALILYALKIQI